MIYAIKREDGKLFEVLKRHNGKYEIIENRGLNGRWNACLSDLLWSSIEPFDSFIQAARWLKANVNELL